MTEHDTGSSSPSAPTPDSVQVIETIADYLNQEPSKVDFTLYEHVDPDALDTLLETSTTELAVAFTIENILITVSNDGTINIKEREE